MAADEKSEVSLSATGTDSDGTIQSYSWVQTGGSSVTLSSDNSASITFTAPIAKTEETLTFEVTVADDDGATGSDTVSITVMPVNEISFQIQGMVTNGQGIASDIELILGGDPVTVSTDQDGLYTLDIAEDEDFGDNLVFMQSVSTADPEIVFTNIPESLQNLFDKSGDDNILDSNDDITVNLTPLSTAYYGIILQNIDQVLTEDDIANTIGQISGAEAVTLATDLKLISENNSGVNAQSKLSNANASLALPDRFSDTLAFARDRVGIAQYNTSLISLGNDIFDIAKGELLGDPNISKYSGAAQSDFPVVLTMNTPGGFVVSRVTLNADNTGLYSQGGAETDAVWSEDTDGVLTFNGANGDPLSQAEVFTFKEVNGTFIQVRSLISTTEVTMTPLLDLPVGTLYDFALTVEQTFPDDPGIPAEDLSNSFEVSFISGEEYLDFNIDGLFGTDTSKTLLTSFFKSNFNPIITGPSTAFGDRQFHYNADYITLSRSGTDMNGTATTTYAGDYLSNGVWELTDPKTVTVTFDSNRDGPVKPLEITYSKISPNLTTVIAYEAGEIDGLSNGVFAVQDTTQLPASDMDAEGFYNFPFGLSATSQSVFWTELKSGNDAELVTVFDSDGDGIQEQNEVNIRNAKWELDTNGTIIVSEYRFPVTRAPNCDPDIDGICVLSRRSRLNIADRNGSDAYVLNELSVYAPNQTDPNMSDEFFYQFTARRQEYGTTAPIDISALPPG